MPGVALISVFKYLSLAGSGAAALKLGANGLYRHYRIFFAYLLFRVPNGIWPILLGTESRWYERCWVFTEPVVLLFNVLMVSELYRLILDKYPGIYSLGRTFLYVGVPLSVTISAITLLPKITRQTSQHSQVLPYYFAAERGIDLSLAIFILLILVFLAVFRVPLARNVRIHAAVFSVYFLAGSMALLVRTLFGLRVGDLVNLLLTGASCGCILAWLFLLNPRGESLPAKEAISTGALKEERILVHLDALNRTLSRASRQISAN